MSFLSDLDKKELPEPPTYQEDHDRRSQISHWRLVRETSIIVPEVFYHPWEGSGIPRDPYLIDWIPLDPRNPLLFTRRKKWLIASISAISTLVMAFCSSVYTGGLADAEKAFDTSRQTVLLGLSMYVVGFAIGPLLWAPMSELYGRQIVFSTTYGIFAISNILAINSQDIVQVIILRFLAGASGSSSLTNTGGVIADMFTAKDRGLATSIFTAAPFVGPVLGPIIGGFLGESAGFRAILFLIAVVSSLLWAVYYIYVPETYAPVLLRLRASALSDLTGQSYVSRLDHTRGKKSTGEVIKTALSRPWLLLFREPIVAVLSLYMAIIFGSMYMMFSAYPIIFQQGRGFSPGLGGLAFLGIGVGMIIALLYMMIGNKKYAKKASSAPGGKLPPEDRLPPSMIGAVAAPLGLFWFAIAAAPEVYFLVSIIGTVLFGFGMVVIFLSLTSYLIDTYTIFAASVLAASAVLRSIFAAVFPLFVAKMYAALGVNWATSVPAFLSLACVPFPFLLYKYGERIREKGKYAQEAKQLLTQLMKAKEPVETHSSNKKDYP
ncbi:MFS general substrate transporter [Bisporella sp. PMI_857]|nr:MFS general substrate transporter [Bisporella sp. PMI_857]